MSVSLAVGANATRHIVVDRDRTIGFMGEEVRVYATPALVYDIEHLCRDLILEHAGEGMDSVGFEVSIRHMAPTLLGMEVVITAAVAETEGPKVVLEITASDPLDTICTGRHVRFIVDVEKTKQRLQAKADKAAATSQG